MDFGKKLLNKYGWSEGQGLGKNNDGIKKPLKANYKFDKAGFGENQAESDFNNHWWQRVYNDAAQNVEVKPNENGHVTTKLKVDAESVEISTLSYSAKKLKKAKQTNDSKDEKVYGNFMQAATLINTGAEIENENKVDNIDIAKYKILTDAQLFEACGGRTAHKGARHGLNLNGKLKRVLQQEQELFEEMQGKLKAKESNEMMKTNKNYENEIKSTQQSEKQSKKMKTTHKIKKKRKLEQTVECVLNATSTSIDDFNTKTDRFEGNAILKKHKKQQNNEEQQQNSDSDISLGTVVPTVIKKSKKKTKKQKH